MKDKSSVGAVIATVIALPIVVACCALGPAVVFSVLAGAGGWIAGIGPLLSGVIAIIAGGALYAILRRRSGASTTWTAEPPDDRTPAAHPEK